MKKFTAALITAISLLAASPGASATQGVDSKLKDAVEKNDLSGTPYEILETFFFKGKLYVIQRYTSGTKLRCIQMEHKDNGLLDWGNFAEEEAGTLTDATGVEWGDKILTFHKIKSSNWQIHQRCYHLDDDGNVKMQNWHQIKLEGVEDDDHAGDFIKAVVYKGRLYLFYAYDDSAKGVNICYYISDDYELGQMDVDRGMIFRKRGFLTMSDGRKPVFDNDRYDTWDVATWDAVVPGATPGTYEEKQLLVLARIHEKKLHIYTFDEDNRTSEPDGVFNDVWSYQSKDGFSDKCYRLNLIQGAVDINGMDWNSSNDNPLTIFYSDEGDGIRMTQYTPHDAWSGTFWDQTPFTGLPECTFGIANFTYPLDSPLVNEPQYRNYIHLVGARETHDMFSARFRSNYARCTAIERKIDFKTLMDYPALKPLRSLMSLSMVLEGCPPTTLENDDQIKAISSVTGASDVKLTYAVRNGIESAYDVDFDLKIGGGYKRSWDSDASFFEAIPTLGYTHKYNFTKSKSTGISQSITELFKSMSQKDDAILFYTVPTMCLQTLELYRPNDRNAKVSNYPVTYSLFNTLNSISSVTVSLSELLGIDAKGPLENWDARFGCIELRDCSPLGHVEEICYTRPETRNLVASSSYTESESSTNGVIFNTEISLQLGNLFGIGSGLKFKLNTDFEWTCTTKETTNIDRSLGINYYTADLGREDLSHYDMDMVAIGATLEGDHLNSHNISFANSYYPRLTAMNLPAELGGGPVMLDTDKPLILAYRPVLPLRRAVSSCRPLKAGRHQIDYSGIVDWYRFDNDSKPRHIRITSSNLAEHDWAVALGFDDSYLPVLDDAVWAVYDKATGISVLEFDVKPEAKVLVGVAHRSGQKASPDAPRGEIDVEITGDENSIRAITPDAPVKLTADAAGITVIADGGEACKVTVYNIDGSLMSQAEMQGECHIALPSGRTYVVAIETAANVYTSKICVK